MAVTPAGPNSSLNRYQRALACYQAGNYGACYREIEDLLEEEPRNDAGLALKGMTLLELDRPAEAIEALRTATDVAPRNEEAWLQLGIALMTEGNLADAAEVFQNVLRLNADNIRAMEDLSNVQFMLGNVEQALKTLDRACRLRPGDLSLLRNLAAMYESAGMAEAALDTTRHILELKQDDVPALCDAAWLLVELGQFDEAAMAFRQLQRIDVEHELYAIHGQVMVEIRRRQWRRALSLAIEATRLDRYDFTTSLLSYISGKVFDQESQASEEELLERFEQDHREHRRLHVETT